MFSARLGASSQSFGFLVRWRRVIHGKIKKACEMMKKVSILRMGLLISLSAGSAATAGEISVSGTTISVPISQTTTKQPDGSTVISFTQKGVTRDDDVSSSMSVMSQDCTGTVVVTADGQHQTVGGYCTTSDKDGDTWWLSFMSTGDGSRWTAMGGTGKFEGVTGAGTTTRDVRFPDGRLVQRYEGILTLK